MRQHRGDEKAILDDFRRRQPPAVTGALLELLTVADTAATLDRASPSAHLEIDRLLTLAAAEMSRADRNSFLDQKAARHAFLALFRQLEEAGWGQLIVGRRGHPTRFNLDARSDRGLKRLREHLGEPEGDSSLVRNEAQPAGPSGTSTRESPSRNSVLAQIRAHQSELRSFGVASLGLFGSVARNQAKPDSDVDILVDFNEPVTSDRFFGVKFLLEDLLGRRIDLVTRSALREPIRRAIESELVDVA